MILKIAFRNIIKNKWRSLLIGFALLISTFFLLVSNASMNGIEDQVISGYVNFQSGHVAVMWSGMKEVSPTDPSRFMQKLVGYNPERDADNLEAQAKLDQFLADNKAQIDRAFPSIMRLARYSVGDKNDQIIIFGLTQEHADYLQESKTLNILNGNLPKTGNYEMCISEFVSQDTGLLPGDTVTIRVTSVNSEVREQEFQISGIYANGAGYDNFYAFMPDEEARLLTGVPQPLFDIHRVYLRDIAKAKQFAQELNEFLESPVLYAESYLEASPFYTNNSRSMRLMFNVFLFFILIIIGVGLLATIRMNLFERMKEFGTLRAIGYSRSQNFALIFAEMFILAALSLAVALIMAGILIAILGHTGIYVGSGPVSYGIGGERIWPEMRMNDIILAVAAIIVFALVATLGPGLGICYQEITDLVLKRQRRMFLPARIIKEWF